jgi:uncharacterized Rmd1/YagE family protein
MEIRSVSPQPYRIKAMHIAERLKLRDLREKFSRPTLEFSNYELAIRYADDSFMFLYNYGSIVFFNVPDELQERELSNIQEYRTPSDVARTSEVFLFEVQDQAGDSIVPTRVFFDRVVASGISYERVKIVCTLLAESTALEYYEILIENLLEKTNIFSKKLERQGRVIESSEELIKFIGMCLSTKQEIISNLYIVDTPDETWDSPLLDKLYHELKLMFEIDTRYRALEYKIKIVQESVEVIVDLSTSKRGTLLEMIIIILITFEVLLSIIKWH